MGMPGNDQRGFLSCDLKTGSLPCSGGCPSQVNGLWRSASQWNVDY